jgi:hypothetical protein
VSKPFVLRRKPFGEYDIVSRGVVIGEARRTSDVYHSGRRGWRWWINNGPEGQAYELSVARINIAKALLAGAVETGETAR